MPEAPKNLKEFNSLIQIIADLRGPEGCPWDKEQTHQTITSYAIEEVHEFVEAVENHDDLNMCEELGDVLFQVILHSQLAKDRNAFDIHDVIEGISSKIVRRHPHVFAGLKTKDLDEIHKNWDEIKRLEKLKRPKKLKPIDVPESLPALQRAFKIGEKTKKHLFDWTEVTQVLVQLKAEIIELENALAEASSAEKEIHIQHEIGDVLFSAAQVARHVGVEPETSLREANRRFLRRFEKMLEIKNVSIEDFARLSATDKEKLWSDAKKEC